MNIRFLAQAAFVWAAIIAFWLVVLGSVLWALAPLFLLGTAIGR